jgi:hypothetical protein
LLGLSATPGRTWNDPDADEQLSDFFARKKVTLKVPGYENPVKYLIDEGYLAAPQFRRIGETIAMLLEYGFVIGILDIEEPRCNLGIQYCFKVPDDRPVSH